MNDRETEDPGLWETRHPQEAEWHVWGSIRLNEAVSDKSRDRTGRYNLPLTRREHFLFPLPKLRSSLGRGAITHFIKVREREREANRQRESDSPIILQLDFSLFSQKTSAVGYTCRNSLQLSRATYPLGEGGCFRTAKKQESSPGTGALPRTHVGATHT